MDVFIATGIMHMDGLPIKKDMGLSLAITSSDDEISYHRSDSSSNKILAVPDS